MNVEYITDRQLYEKILMERVPHAKSFLWMGTSDLKDLHVLSRGKWVPFLKILAELAHKRVSIRLLHAKEPGKRFQMDFDRYPLLLQGMEKMLCPRVHFKMVIVDGVFGYCGSANLTGAGMGGKADNRRNFENGIITTDPGLLEKMMEQFDRVWRGDFCSDCGRKDFCTEFPEMMNFPLKRKEY
ncbi:MAG: phospholipase D-like domain-containing protein [Anaerohalosphaeraceae bacterium]